MAVLSHKYMHFVDLMLDILLIFIECPIFSEPK